MSGFDHAAEAARIVDAHARSVTLDPISDRGPLGLDDAYAVQAHVVAARLDRGVATIERKLRTIRDIWSQAGT